MSKKKRTFRQKIAKILVSVFVLAIFIVPLVTAGWWFKTILQNQDPRELMSVAALQTRPIDQTNTPLKPFNEPIVTITFDDGWESIYNNALPLLQGYGVRTTQYIIAGTFDHPQYMSVDQIRSMQKAGHEIGSHTMTHEDLTTLNEKDLKWQLTESKRILTEHFGPIRDFASPLGAYNTYTLQAIQDSYRSSRNTEGDPDAEDELQSINVKDSFKPYSIKAFTVRLTTTPEDIKKLLKDTIKHNGWLILTYHQIDESHEAYSVSTRTLEQHLQIISDSPLKSASMGQVLDIVLPSYKGEY